MMWLAPVLFLIAGWLWLNHHFSNPYKATFIFGKKGAGKSCFMVRKMLFYIKRGWHVYTDMADVRIPGVKIIQVGQLEHFRPEPNSVIFLDEVGISMDNRSFKSFPPGLRDFFKFARKMQCIVYMNSQAYDVDKKVRDTTDSMILMQSIGSFLCIARPIIRSITLTAPSAEAESRIADTLRFGNIFSWRFYYMPAYFRYFNSKAMPPRPVISAEEPKDADDRYLHSPIWNLGKDLIDFVCSKPSRLFKRRK